MSQTSVVFPNPACFHEENGTVRLIAGECPSCGRRFFPKEDWCPNCLSTELKARLLSPVGTVYTYTVVHQKSGMGIPSPYVLAFVDFPEDVRVLMQLETNPQDVRIGMEVSVVLGKIGVDDQGNDLISYKGRPAGRRDV